jgi:hypothetical protein
MRHVRNIASLLALAMSTSAIAAAAIAAVGGANYAGQYDFDELRAATHGKPMRVEMHGNPFPGIAVDDVARQMLQMIQAAQPQRLQAIYTFDKAIERPRPEYRLVLVFDAANNLNSSTACAGTARHKPGKPGHVHVFAVYCRNDQVMSETTAWTDAGGPGDPRLGQMLFDTLSTVFSNSPALRPQGGLDRQ